MGRNGSRHGAQTKRGRRTLSAAALPPIERARILPLSCFPLDSQVATEPNSFRFPPFPTRGNARHKTFRTTRTTANSVGREGGRRNAGGMMASQSFARVDWTAARVCPRAQVQWAPLALWPCFRKNLRSTHRSLSGKWRGRGAVRRDAPGNFYHAGPNGSAVHSDYNTATAASSSSVSTSQLLAGK